MADLFLTHITTEGERWDAIAYRYYGDPTMMERVIVANPTVPITSRLASGLTLAIPVVEQQTATPTGLPPWKQ
jgi:phage tail protein X